VQVGNLARIEGAEVTSGGSASHFGNSAAVLADDLGAHVITDVCASRFDRLDFGWGRSRGGAWRTASQSSGIVSGPYMAARAVLTPENSSRVVAFGNATCFGVEILMA
jgi:hypothetical protein